MLPPSLGPSLPPHICPSASPLPGVWGDIKNNLFCPGTGKTRGECGEFTRGNLFGNRAHPAAQSAFKSHSACLPACLPPEWLSQPVKVLHSTGTPSFPRAQNCSLGILPAGQHLIPPQSPADFNHKILIFWKSLSSESSPLLLGSDRMGPLVTWSSSAPICSLYRLHGLF